jgi:hypothetical protein
MLSDAKSQALIDNFFAQWLELGLLESAVPDPRLFPQFNDALRQAMRAETLLQCRYVVRQNRSIMEFLDAPYTFLNGRLAEHYRIDGVRGDQMRKVDVRRSGRGGLLTQAAVLTLTSHATRTSPVKRGKWILTNILGTPPPPPPPDVGDLPDDRAEAEVVGTLRERLIAHQERAECAVCHVRMDNLGFGFEHYDAVGAWRQRDGGHLIDSSGTLPGDKAFTGAGELRALLHAERADQFARCLAEKMLTFALGRELTVSDRGTVNSIVRDLQRDDYRMQTLIEQIVLSRPFRFQRMPPEPKIP